MKPFTLDKRKPSRYLVNILRLAIAHQGDVINEGEVVIVRIRVPGPIYLEFIDVDGHASIINAERGGSVDVEWSIHDVALATLSRVTPL